MFKNVAWKPFLHFEAWLVKLFKILIEFIIVFSWGLIYSYWRFRQLYLYLVYIQILNDVEIKLYDFKIKNLSLISKFLIQGMTPGYRDAVFYEQKTKIFIIEQKQSLEKFLFVQSIKSLALSASLSAFITPKINSPYLPSTWFSSL